MQSVVEAIDKAVKEVAKFDAGELIQVEIMEWLTISLWTDDWFVIAITDANFGQYNITAEDLQRVMTRQPKVNSALICIGEGAEAAW